MKISVCFLTFLFSAVPNYHHSQARERKENSLLRVTLVFGAEDTPFTHLLLIPASVISQV